MPVLTRWFRLAFPDTTSGAIKSMLGWQLSRRKGLRPSLVKLSFQNILEHLKFIYIPEQYLIREVVLPYAFLNDAVLD
jgi:hypothetical protein